MKTNHAEWEAAWDTSHISERCQGAVPGRVH